MSDKELERRAREYFAARANEHTPPDFEWMLANATAQGRHRRILPWLVPALAASVAASAALAVAIALLRTGQHDATTPASAELIAELSTSTHWTAPSDRWLGRQMPMQLRALPDFEPMTTLPEDTNAWL